MRRTEPLSGDLLKLKNQIRTYAVDYGLDFFEVIFEICDYEVINILAAQGGFPTRYPHWRFGMDFEQLSKGYAYGMSKIYEMVINTDPCYAYLLKGNHIVDQKIVMAHVYGHSDFFKNNYWFKNTDRNMINTMANHGAKIRRYMAKEGIETVELFIDRILSIENLININNLYETPELIRRREWLDKLAKNEDGEDHTDDRSQALKSFMSSKKRREKKNQKDDDKKLDEEDFKLIQETAQLPERDIMKFVADYAPLKDWQLDIIGMIRDEAYYFLPQRLTKIMNEGWASYWHSKIMTEKALTASEVIDFADHHSGVTAMPGNQINPYKIGIELFRDIEYRYDTGKFGKEYNDCGDIREKENWNKKTLLGREKIFELRRSHNDVTFIDEFLTPEFCIKHKLFVYKYNPRTGRNEIDTRDFEAIKHKMLAQLTNFGSPIIEVDDSNFNNRGELLLAHVHYGVDLDMGFALDTMKNLFALWKRPINLRTNYEDKEIIFHFDGKELRPLN